MNPVVKGRARDAAAFVSGRAARVLVTLLMIAAVGAAQAQAPIGRGSVQVTGRNVVEVSFGQQGRALGRLRQAGAGRWQETGNDGAVRFSFDESGRDDWSVYLDDRSRGVRLQIDLHRRQVLYGDGRSRQMSPLYDILGSSAGAPVAQAPAPPARPQSTPSRPASPARPQAPPVASQPGRGETSEAGKDFCWKDTQTRGAGRVPQDCGPGRERIGLLCYSRCPPNSKRFGFDCHSVCPSGMRDDGLFCRASEYGRGAGYPIHFGEFDGKGMRKRCEKDHGKGGCEVHGAIYYPKCKPGYKPFGCCLCRPQQPNCAALGMNPGVDLSCAKRVVIGDPEPGVCRAGEERDGGLCYPRCPQGYTGVGPVCWTGAPRTWVECGMGAARTSAVCGQITFGQVASVGQLAFNVATFGQGAVATSAAGGASKAAKASELRRRYQQLKDLYQRNKELIKQAQRAKGMASAGLSIDNVRDDEVVTEEDIVRIAAEIAAIADPTGVAGTVAAYTYPKCSKYGF